MNWSHKVVKTQRGGDGKWFRYRAAMTGTEAEARAYASEFAHQQAGVCGVRILVLTRGGHVVCGFAAAEALA